MKKIKKFNENFQNGIDPYNEERWETPYDIEKIKALFYKTKTECAEDLEKFKKSFDILTRLTSPGNWRSTGHFYVELKAFEETFKKMGPLSEKDLQSNIVLKELEGVEGI